MTNIYDRHDKAFSGTEAYVLINPKQPDSRLATIAFKRGSTGNVRCFFHFIGYEMTCGNAGGYGYDKCSAAFLDAVEKHYKNISDIEYEAVAKDLAKVKLILDAAVAGNGSSRWHNALRNAGFYLFQAV